MKPRITFTEEALPFILDALGMEIRDNVVFKEGKPVRQNGMPILATDIMGIQGNFFFLESSLL